MLNFNENHKIGIRGRPQLRILKAMKRCGPKALHKESEIRLKRMDSTRQELECRSQDRVEYRLLTSNLYEGLQ